MTPMTTTPVITCSRCSPVMPKNVAPNRTGPPMGFRNRRHPAPIMAIHSRRCRAANSAPRPMVTPSQRRLAGRQPASLRWLGVTMGLGALFAALHLREWIAMIGAGWRLFRNPMGGPVLFGATFFGITGLHLLHVITGVVVIGVIALGFRRGRFDAGHVETTGLYWHFVDLVWMFVFPLVYLLNVR